jgi:LysR family glycine cleavage system transcriptional activator
MQETRAGLSMVPPIHSLVAFETVARLKSATVAARELGVSRSALSHSLTLLEHRLGVRLFSRYTPSATLTAAGQIYYEAVGQFARSVAEGLYDISGNARIALRLSVSPGLSRLWLSRRLPHFQAEFPRIELSLSVSESLSDILGHQADIALRYGGTDEPGTISVDLWQETIAPVARAEMAGAATGRSLADLVNHLPLIEHAHWSWDGWLAAVGFSGSFSRPVLVCRDLTLMLEAAMSGFGVAIAPMTLIADYVGRGDLVQAHPLSLPGKTYRAVASAADSSRPAVRAFLQWVERQAPGRGPQAPGRGPLPTAVAR